jgi:hypothetical protein
MPAGTRSLSLCVDSRFHAWPTSPPAQQHGGIKRRRYEEKGSYEVEGVVNITFPVLDDRGYAIAALTLSPFHSSKESATPRPQPR